MIACIALAASMTSATITNLGGSQYMLQLMPLALASLGLICSLLGILTVKIFSSQSPETALRYGTIGSAVIFVIASYFLINSMGVSSGVYSVESYDAANILLAGIKAGKTTRAAMLKYVKSYNGKSVTGNTIKFDKNGDISYGLFAGFTSKGGVLVNTGIIK